MTSPFETLKGCAEDASFQLSCAQSHVTWMLAIARSIHLAHTNGQADVGADLIGLASYLSDSYGHFTVAIQQFDEIAESCAPQNVNHANRGAEVESELKDDQHKLDSSLQKETVQ